MLLCRKFTMVFTKRRYSRKGVQKGSVFEVSNVVNAILISFNDPTSVLLAILFLRISETTHNPST